MDNVNEVNAVEVAKDTMVCPHCNGEIIIEKSAGRKGKLAGISIEDMTDEQLKVEKINAGSVLYKAIKRGASAEIIAKNQERVEAAKAESAKRKPVVVETVATPTESVYAEETPVTAEY